MPPARNVSHMEIYPMPVSRSSMMPTAFSSDHLEYDERINYPASYFLTKGNSLNVADISPSLNPTIDSSKEKSPLIRG